MADKPKKNSSASNFSEDISDQMTQKIRNLIGGLSAYSTRELVEDTQNLGEKLVSEGLKTNQIRKFLDAINQLKAKLKVDHEIDAVRSELPLLRAKLAYAAARQRSKNSDPVEPMKKVLDIAIERVRPDDEFFAKDFARLVQLIESTIAYHKYAGGKDQ